VNRPKLTQAASSVMRSVQTGTPPRAWAPANVSTMRPNRTGSANCAAASETLAFLRRYIQRGEHQANHRWAAKRLEREESLRSNMQVGLFAPGSYAWERSKENNPALHAEIVADWEANYRRS
jgi:hypothetical protein